MVTSVSTPLTADPSTSKAEDIRSSDRDSRTQEAARSVLHDSQRRINLQKREAVRLFFLPPPVLDAPSSDSDSDSDIDEWDCDASKQPKKSINKSVEQILLKENRI